MKIAPSILAADFTYLGEQIKAAEKGGADWLHLDVMDGHFVPNISFGPLIVEAVRKVTDLTLDVHLMVENPERYIPEFRAAGADIITVHVETCNHLHRTLNLIRETGALAGVALNPATSEILLQNVIEDVDLVLAMTVNPGFGGQKFITGVLRKIEGMAALIRQSGRKIHLEVDGGVDLTTTADVVRAGADVLVAGSAIFGMQDIAKAITDIRRVAERALGSHV